jgi:hypothetical protein
MELLVYRAIFYLWRSRRFGCAGDRTRPACFVGPLAADTGAPERLGVS